MPPLLSLPFVSRCAGGKRPSLCGCMPLFLPSFFHKGRTEELPLSLRSRSERRQHFTPQLYLAREDETIPSPFFSTVVEEEIHPAFSSSLLPELTFFFPWLPPGEKMTMPLRLATLSSSTLPASQRDEKSFWLARITRRRRFQIPAPPFRSTVMKKDLPCSSSSLAMPPEDIRCRCPMRTYFPPPFLLSAPADDDGAELHLPPPLIFRLRPRAVRRQRRSRGRCRRHLIPFFPLSSSL